MMQSFNKEAIHFARDNQDCGTLHFNLNTLRFSHMNQDNKCTTDKECSTSQAVNSDCSLDNAKSTLEQTDKLLNVSNSKELKYEYSSMCMTDPLTHTKMHVDVLYSTELDPHFKYLSDDISVENILNHAENTRSEHIRSGFLHYIHDIADNITLEKLVPVAVSL